jgi:hypothetical protein
MLHNKYVSYWQSFFAPITNIVGCHWPFQKWNDNITTYVNKLNKVKLSLKKKNFVKTKSRFQ